MISSSIQRNIPGLKIFPIRKDGDLNKTMYVVQIPSSTEAPHICKDKKFYKRYNFSPVAMEEYEVRQLYGRKVKSMLALSSYSITQLPISGEFTKFDCIGSIQNIGKTIEDNYKLNVYLNNFPDKTGVHWDAKHHNRNLSYTHMDEKKFKISASSICPIYPGEKLDTIRFNFKIRTDLLLDAIEKSTVDFILMYPNEEDKCTPKLKDFITTSETSFQ